MGERVPDLRHPANGGEPGLALLPHLRVLPHYDRMARWIPGALTRPLFRTGAGVSVVGIDEDTALVGGPDTFTVQGRQSVWLLSDGHRRGYPAGSTIDLGPK